MTYVHDKKKNGKKVNLDKGFGITKKDNDKAVDTKFVIDVNKRRSKDGTTGEKPKFTQ